MKSKIKNVIKIICFLSIFILIFNALGIVFDRSGEDTTFIYKDFYKQQKNTIDVLFVGGSSVYFGVSTPEIRQKTGTNCYNLSCTWQKIWESYYWIKESLKYQHPKVIVLEVEQIGALCKNESKESKIFNIESMRNGKIKFQMINDPLLNFSNYEKMTFSTPLILFHNRWTEKDKMFLSFFNRDENSKKIKSGYIYTQEQDNLQLFNKEAKLKISDDAKKYLLEINELCKKNNILLILTKIPEPKYWNENYYNEVKTFAKENNIEYMNINDSVKLDYKKDFFNNGEHLNYYGATKISDYISEYLKLKKN